LHKLLIVRPNIGDFAFGQTSRGAWHRGYVIFILPDLQMAMVDKAELMDVYNLATCEKPLSNMYAYTAICEITNAKCNLYVRSIVCNMLLNIMYVNS
jgi:hypothetical protein